MRVETPQADAASVDLLILGAGWTSNYLIPLLQHEGINYAATTTTGHDQTVAFKFDPTSHDPAPFAKLPEARTILIAFPLKGTGQSKLLTSLYAKTHPSSATRDSGRGPRYIQFGVSSIWVAPNWQDDTSPYNTSDPRAVAEDELLNESGASAAVLSLSGLYGGARQPRNWVDRVIRTKEDLRAKGALHVIHGADVARAVVALHRNFTPGDRWLLCDLHVYDWWDLVQDWSLAGLTDEVLATEDGKAAAEKNKTMSTWVAELMVEEGVKALPRDASKVGRALDGRAFWLEFGMWPSKGRIR